MSDHETIVDHLADVLLGIAPDLVQDIFARGRRRSGGERDREAERARASRGDHPRVQLRSEGL
jgi:hypothetical protein